MIVLKNLTKVFSLYGHKKVVANNINVTFPTGVSVGLMGRNGAGKSTLLKLIAGTTHPTSGEVLSTGSVSFPVGLASSLHPDLTGAQNTRFVARIYGADTDALLDYVEEFAELGEHFHLPVRSYSSGMKGRISFGINMGLKFETYLIDEITAVGDASFKKKSRDIFLDRMRTSGAVFVTHSPGTIRELCTAGAFLEDGDLHYYTDIEEAIERYNQMLEEGMSRAVNGAAIGERISFPYDARMLFGIGLPQTRIDWLGDCLRRHRPCHFSRTRELHYFDTRAGLLPVIPERRFKTTEQLATRLQGEKGEAQRNTLRLLGDVSSLLSIHSAPDDGPDRHKAYLDYLMAERKTQPIVCDFTPEYALLSEDAFREMAMIGQAWFVCVLRDPAARLWAQIWENLPGKNRNEMACIQAAQSLIDAPDGLSAYPAADYARLFTALDDAVPAARQFWLFHENMTGRDSLRALSDFLDVPNVPEISMLPLPDAPEPEMPNEIRNGLRQLLEPQYTASRSRFGDDLPATWNFPELSHSPHLHAELSS